MKKYLMFILAVVLLSFSAVCAQETETVQEINWENVAPAVEEAGLEGKFYNIADLGIAMWVPDKLTEVELTEEDVEGGYLCYLSTAEEDAVVAVVAADVQGMTLQEWSASLSEDQEVTEMEFGIINGIEAFTYKVPGDDTQNVDFATDAGYIVEFTFWPASDEAFSQVSSIMVASIQPYAE